MLRHRAKCNQCGQTSHWCRDPEESRREILRHLKEAHGLGSAQESGSYQIAAERQCDYCLEPYLDDCTKCRHDFCRSTPGTSTACAAATSEWQA